MVQPLHPSPPSAPPAAERTRARVALAVAPAGLRHAGRRLLEGEMARLAAR